MLLATSRLNTGTMRGICKITEELELKLILLASKKPSPLRL